MRRAKHILNLWLCTSIRFLGLLFSRPLQQGFTLLELLPVLIIVGMFGAMTMTLGSKWVESEENGSNKQRLETIEMAMEKYLKLNNRLPCPAQLNLFESHNDYGKEAVSPDPNNPCLTGSIQATLITGTEVVMGTIPVQTLGLEKNMMKDIWGNMIVYYTDHRMTEENAIKKYSSQNTDIGDIRILDASGAFRTNKAVYAFLSFGPNAHGALQPGALYINKPTPNTLEQENNHFNAAGTATTLNRDLVQAVLMDGFDDEVVFKSRNQLSEHTISDSAVLCAGQTLTWSASGNNCIGIIGELDDGASSLVKDVSSSDTGQVTATCNKGTLGLSNPICINNGTNCAAPGPQSWGGGNCSGTSNETVADGTTIVLPSTSGYTGNLTLSCSGGTLSILNQTCRAPCDLSSLSTSWGPGNSCTAAAVAGTIPDGDTFTLSTQGGPPYGNITYTCSNGSWSLLSGSTSCQSTPHCEGINISWDGAANGCYGYAGADNHQNPPQTIKDMVPPTTGRVEALCNSGVFSKVSGTQVCTMRCEAQAVTWSTNDSLCSATTSIMEDGEAVVLTDAVDGTATATCQNGVIALTSTECNAPAIGCVPSAGYTPTSISSGYLYNCGVSDDGNAYCWGYNGYGVLGDGTSIERTEPVQVIKPTGVSYFTKITTGNNHACAIADNDKAYCWGRNTYGQLGDGTTANRINPVEVPAPGGVSHFTSITAGANHTCAIGDNGKAYCWGFDANGELGDGGPGVNQSSPSLVVQPSGTTSFIQISAGTSHTCGVANNSGGYCWGSSIQGQLGEGTLDDEFVPKKVIRADLVPLLFTEIHAGYRHSCGIEILGELWCWGDNDEGQVGQGNTSDFRSYPRKADMPPGVSSIIYLDAGYGHSCAIGNNGNAYCWGENVGGSLGNGTTTTDEWAPALVLGGGGYTAISTWSGSCGVKGDATYCWGDNNYGQQGIGTSSGSHSTPTATHTGAGYTPGNYSPPITCP